MNDEISRLLSDEGVPRYRSRTKSFHSFTKLEFSLLLRLVLRVLKFEIGRAVVSIWYAVDAASFLAENLNPVQ